MNITRCIVVIVAFVVGLASSKCVSANDDLIESIQNNDPVRLKELLTEAPYLANKHLPAPYSRRKPLHLSSLLGHVALIEILLEAGADIGGFDGNDMTPLMLTAVRGNLEAAELLLRSGANPNDFAKGNGAAKSALGHAVDEGHLEMAKLLLKSGADVQLGPTLSTAIYRDHFDAAMLLLDAGADPNEPDAMNAAAERGSLELLRVMLDKGGNANGQSYYGGVLHNACDSLEKVKLLIERGADVNGYYPNSFNYGMRPIHAAAQKGNPSVTKFLIQNGADVNVLMVDRQTPLDMALRNQNQNEIDKYKEVVQLLLANGSKPTFASSVALNETEVVRALVEDNAKLVNQPLPGEYAPRPIHIAIHFNSWDVFKELLKAKADPNLRLGDISPLHLAVLIDNTLAVQLLLEHGADPNAQLVLGRYGSGAQTPLHFALATPTNGGLSFPTPARRPDRSPKVNLEIVNLLVQHGADPTIQNELRDSPLYLAKLRGDKVLISTLEKAATEFRKANAALEDISGNWQVSSCQQPLLDNGDRHRGYRVSFENGEVSARDENDQPSSIFGTWYRVNPKTTPMQIVFPAPSPGIDLMGIYKIDNDTLTLCVRPGQYPQEFKPVFDQRQRRRHQVVYVLKRLPE